MFNLFKKKETQKPKSFADQMWFLSARYEMPTHRVEENIRDGIRHEARQGRFVLSTSILRKENDLSSDEKREVIEQLGREGLKIKAEPDFYLSISWDK